MKPIRLLLLAGTSLLAVGSRAHADVNPSGYTHRAAKAGKLKLDQSRPTATPSKSRNSVSSPSSSSNATA